MFVAPIAGRLTDRIGPRPLIVAGLGIVAVSLFLQSQIDSSSAYSSLLVPFILMGFGIAMTMSPMSTAAMNAVSETKAGLASGLLSMSRMVGGTFGVAALGAIFQAHGRSDLNSALKPIGVSDGTIERDQPTSSASAASSGRSRRCPPIRPKPPPTPPAMPSSTRFATSVGISAAVAAAGAVAAIFLISKKRPGAEAPSPKPEAPVEPMQPAAPELAGSLRD